MKRIAAILLLSTFIALMVSPVVVAVNNYSGNQILRADGADPPPPFPPTLLMADGVEPPPPFPPTVFELV